MDGDGRHTIPHQCHQSATFFAGAHSQEDPRGALIQASPRSRGSVSFVGAAWVNTRSEGDITDVVGEVEGAGLLVGLFQQNQAGAVARGQGEERYGFPGRGA
jgi:hypothetical protein